MNVFADTWFFNKGWRPHRFQQETWSAIADGQSGLLNAPTGYGKTFAVWFGIVQRYYRSQTKPKGVHCLWITPLRALSAEILQATRTVSEDLELDYNIGLRTGDTDTNERQRQRKTPPQALITTPESIHLLLASKGYHDYFRQLEFVVVDEWHELVGSKRGVLVELALSRLRKICPNLCVWGISATIGNLREAMDILLGANNRGRLVKADLKKAIYMETLLPDTLDRFPWAGHLGTKMVNKVLPIIQAHRSTLLFTNTRSQAEIWYHHLLAAAPELAGAIAIHHGSLSEELRQWVEDALHRGVLKAVVCTSSLDLGVDFRPVDCVVQIGSPKGVARFIQRAGRSGHRPGETSKIYFLPTHSLEIMEGAAIRYAVENGLLEQRLPYVRSFDVLVQYMVTLAVSDGFRADELYAEVKNTHCFASISREEFDECLLMITKGGRTLDTYEEFHKVVLENDVYRVTSKPVAMRHRLSIGAIVSDTMMRVKFLSGKYLGTIEEWFISRLQPGNTFWFSGRLLELVRVKDIHAIVRPAAGKKGAVPSWMGGRFPISDNFGAALRHTFTELHGEPHTYPAELDFLQPLFDEQRKVSELPTADELLVEYIHTRYGYHLFVFPFEGKLVHEGMAAVVAYRLSSIRNASFSIASNEYGFELLCDHPLPLEEALQKGLFSTEKLFDDIQSGINIREMARRKFRDIAGIAGLVFQGYPGKPMKTKHLQANSGLFFSVFEEFDSDNLLLRQAYDEVYDFQLEASRMYKAFERIETHRIVLQRPGHLTPFAFPVFAESFRERYSNEDWQARLEKLKTQLEA
ncbi:ligase-associated DNA damage response DEXH box helicase [Parapedobacter sp. ISTM3]|uniref:ATP-dependent helicase Lhr and Lhr-like helicase n=1 Tax=Parapedobacter luteus TaxID=623280 RepID=A0A1T5AZ44_9SPHI|nr:MULTISPECIES: ligase-associated DNA damage response DEXH box helicase [Parapedobacter]MBK1440370.1 ligase-associated DNA damage response DEXH box helicase [Parapedobacter sp. ISTM3]SKB40030.1 ATP-dependent helicase Lhr and Lhr-like helicase [Parapedobacter luteus]